MPVIDMNNNAYAIGSEENEIGYQSNSLRVTPFIPKISSYNTDTSNWRYISMFDSNACNYIKLCQFFKILCQSLCCVSGVCLYLTGYHKHLYHK